MGHAWVTEDGFKVDECRVTEWATPGLPRTVPGFMNAEKWNGFCMGFRGWSQG